MLVINGDPAYRFHIDMDNDTLYVEIDKYITVDQFVNQFIPEYKRTLVAFHGRPYNYALLIPSTWDVNLNLMGEFINWMRVCVEKYKLHKIAAVSVIPEIKILAKVVKESLGMDDSRVGVFISVDDMKEWLKEE